MRLLRVFGTQSWVSNWLEQSPPLPLLLKCFDVNRQKPQPEPVSVYRIDSEIEEVEAVAALFLTTPGSPEKRFGVIVAEDDCCAAGITLDPEEQGETGVHAIDKRHVNLKGTVDQFGRLVARIVQGMWEGEQRIRLYPAQQIAGQIALFSKLGDDQIDPDTKTTCLEVLALKNWHTFEENDQAVIIRGALKDNSEFSILARRGCRS
jgi:hypothetical protein